MIQSRSQISSVSLVVLLVLLIPTSNAMAVSVINLTHWAIADGGNDHWYAIIAEEHSWQQTSDLANALTIDSHSGYLATVASQAENDFMLSVVSGVFPPERPTQFWLGGRRNPLNLTEWQWVTGETFSYTNWWTDEGITVTSTALAMFGDVGIGTIFTPGQWNDTDGEETGRLWGLVEWGAVAPRTDPIPEPATLLLTALGMAGIAAADQLDSQGFDVVILEAKDRIGGRIWTVEWEDANKKVDLGASWIHGWAEDNPSRVLAREADIDTVETDWDDFQGYLMTTQTPVPSSWVDDTYEVFETLLEAALDAVGDLDSDESLKDLLEKVDEEGALESLDTHWW